MTSVGGKLKLEGFVDLIRKGSQTDEESVRFVLSITCMSSATSEPLTLFLCQKITRIVNSLLDRFPSYRGVH